MRGLSIVVIVLLLVGCAKKRTDRGPNHDGVAVPGEEARPWKPEETLLAQLEPATVAEKYAIRSPKGYRKQATAVAPISMVTWESPARPDGARAWLMVSVVENAGVEPEKVLRDYLAARDSITESLKRTVPEHGRLDGIPFIRASYSGYDRIRKVFIRGHAYAAVDEGRLIQLTAHEERPSEGETLLAFPEAGLLTFRRR
jgi:hypothetical protein